MNLLKITFGCIFLIVILSIHVNAQVLTDWEEKTINDEYTVSMPPNWEYNQKDSYIGSVTQFFKFLDRNNRNNNIEIQVSSNTITSEKNKDNLEENLQLFNLKSGFNPLTSPIYGDDNVTIIGNFKDEKFGIVNLRLMQGDVIKVISTFKTIDEIEDFADIFSTISMSITTLNSSSKDNTYSNPTSSSNIKPRTTPTVKATVRPTSTPKPTYQSTPRPTVRVTPKTTPIPTQVYVAPAVVSGGGVCDCSGDTKNCGDFNCQEEAQRCHDYCYSKVGDIHKLDQDGNGVVCESKPSC